jgi:multiple sugar transport system ATP-binding protein
MALGNRIGVLYDGRFRQLGSPQGVYRNPVNTRVARLFGDPGINLLSVRARRSSEFEFDLELGGEQLCVARPLGAIEGRECLLGIRPEDIQVHLQPQDDALRLELDAVTPLNLREVLLLKSRDGTEILSSTSEAKRFGRGHTEVWARINWDRAIFFDSESGDALTVE